MSQSESCYVCNKFGLLYRGTCSKGVVTQQVSKEKAREGKRRQENKKIIRILSISTVTSLLLSARRRSISLFQMFKNLSMSD